MASGQRHHPTLVRQRAIGAFVGAVVTAGGMSIVAVLVLRALGEWRELQDRK